MLHVIGRKVNEDFVYLREDWKTRKEDAYSDDLGLAKVFESYEKAEKECSSDEIPMPVIRGKDGGIFLA